MVMTPPPSHTHTHKLKFKEQSELKQHPLGDTPIVALVIMHLSECRPTFQVRRVRRSSGGILRTMIIIVILQ